MQNQNIEKILCFSEIFTPNSPRKCLRMDRKGTERTEMGPKVDRNLDFLENLRMREIKGLKIIMRIGLSHVKI